MPLPPAPFPLNPQDIVSTPLKIQPWAQTGACGASGAMHGPLLISVPGSSPCYPLTGLLVVRNSQISKAGAEKLDTPETTPISVVLLEPPAAGQLQSQVPEQTLVVAVVPVLLALIVSWVKKRSPVDPVEGDPDWDFGKSWSANVTLFVGFLNALLAFGGLPGQTLFLPKNSYLISMIAIAMIGMGPLIFASIQRKGHGILATFYAAGLIVLWAAYIQFALVWLILMELVHAEVLTAATNLTLEIALTAMALFLFVYAFLGLKQAAIDSTPEPQEAKAETGLGREVAVLPQAKTWHLI
jgi:hypothetical protein